MQIILILIFFIGFSPSLSFGKECSPKTLHPLVGLPLKEFAKKEARTYRTLDKEEWQTFNCGSDMVTFHFIDGNVADWKINDRAEVADEYLGEFASQAFVQGNPKIYAAIKAALTKIPQEAFLSVTDRARPVIFTEYHYTGIGRFANSSNIISFEDDAPSMSEGLTIIKLSDELEDAAESEQEIEGIILHELAHRVLEHAKQKIRSCKMEREANQLVKKWGYEKEYIKAKERFGDKTRTDAEKCPE